MLHEVHEQLRAAQPRGLSREQLAEREQALLTAFHDLFRTGYLAWGFNLSNPDPPFFHVTEQGRRALRDISRNPANPEGYLAHLRARGKAPGDTQYANQQDLDDVLRAYGAGLKTRVSKATLLEFGDWHAGMDADEPTRARLFRARVIIGFSGLSQRRLLVGHMGYCCYDTDSADVPLHIEAVLIKSGL